MLIVCPSKRTFVLLPQSQNNETANHRRRRIDWGLLDEQLGANVVQVYDSTSFQHFLAL